MNAGCEASWPTLGTHAHLLVTDPSALVAAEIAVREVLARVDRTYSRFRADSELVALNAAAGRRVRVSDLLFEAISVAIRAADETSGAVDPTIGHALRMAGYDRDFALLDTPHGVSSAPTEAPWHGSRIAIERVPGWRTVELDPVGRTVRTALRVELDLGSTGKALAADLAARAAADATGVGVLVNLGGDLAIAGDAPVGGWPILCTDDSRTDPTTAGEVIDLGAGAMATSSTAVRRWTAGGVVNHHILDPWTGHPAEGPWRTVSVVAATCVGANAASTAAVVFGDGALGWLAERGLPARLVAHDGAVTRVAGWPEPLSAAA